MASFLFATQSVCVCAYHIFFIGKNDLFSCFAYDQAVDVRVAGLFASGFLSQF